MPKHPEPEHPEPEHTEWVVTTSGDRPLGDVVKALTDAGFVVGQRLDAIGVVTGRASAHAAAAARTIPGVVDVAPNAPVDLGPPDAPVTW